MLNKISQVIISNETNVFCLKIYVSIIYYVNNVLETINTPRLLFNQHLQTS